MNKKNIMIISFAALFVVLILFVSMRKETYSTEEYKYVFENKKEVTLNKHDLQELVVRTAKAFYYNREYIQYKTGYLSSINDIDLSYSDLTISPEELNFNKTVYMDDASFMFSVYLNALGLNLSEGMEEIVDIETGDGFDINSILRIIELENDKRLILESDMYSQQEQVLFASKYLGSLELGDIIVYTDQEGFHLALYIGQDEDGNAKCIYLYDNDGTALYVHNVNEYLFPNNMFINDDTYYAIIRPVNGLAFNSLDKITLKVPVNSLARVDDIYIRRYTDINTYNVYRGEVINYTIEIFNDSDETFKVEHVSDILDNYLVFVSSEDGKYDVANKSIMWNNISLSAGDSRKFTYTAKVAGENEIGSIETEDSVYRKEFVANNAKVLLTQNDYLMLNSIKYKIANKYIEDQKEDLRKVIDDTLKIENSLTYGVSTTDYKTKIEDVSDNSYLKLDDLGFYGFLYYNAFGIDFGSKGITISENIRDNLFTLGEDGYYTKKEIDTENQISVNVNNMVVSNLYGGTLLDEIDKTRMISPKINGKSTYSNLVSGDIIVYWDSFEIMNSYLYVEYDNEGTVVPTLINFSDMGIIKFTDVETRIEKIITRNSLYVVLRPSMIFDVKLENVLLDPISLKVGSEKQLEFVKKPINATINNVNYSISNKFSVDEMTNVIKGIEAGTDVLTMIFNDSIKKEINVVVSKDIYDFKIVTEYMMDEINSDKVIYVGNDVDVDTILGNISFNNSGYDKKIYNSNHEEITDKISDKAILEISLNGELVEQYIIVSFSLVTNTNEEIVENEKIIKYVEIGKKVMDLKNMISFNGNDIDLLFYNSNNELLLDTDGLSTGDYLVFNITNKLQDKYEISVLGDVSGNGIFNGNDVVLTRRHIVGWIDPKTSQVYELYGVYVYSMDFTMNGTVNGNDVSAMRRKLVS